ncbi:NAD(P)/FAD-dependent oxidoreductase [Methylomonas sp. MgM2]
MQIDALIIGQGLAGSILAWEMMRQQFRVVVIDHGDRNASKVAAGLINPVTGQRLVKTPGVDELLPAATGFYRQLGETFKKQFFVPLPILRILKSPREREFAYRRLSEASYQDFLKNCDACVPDINSPFGLLEQQHTGYLRTELLLNTLREFFVVNASYRQTGLEYTEIRLEPNLTWRDLQPKHIVFCEGHRAIANPWFGKLPFQPAKGQILSCRADSAVPNRILNFGNWLIPNDERRFKLGSTFEPGITDNQPTQAARHGLLQSLGTVCPGLTPVEVLAHEVGVRPATLDKQPFIGAHPSFDCLHIFNGFGAKGSMSIPWHARRFVAALKGRMPLPGHCRVQRYEQTYFSI